MNYLFFHPATSEYRKLSIGQDDDGTWAYEWTGRLEREGFDSREAAYADALIEGEKLYSGIIPAKGNENAYGSILVEDDSGI